MNIQVQFNQDIKLLVRVEYKNYRHRSNANELFHFN